MRNRKPVTIFIILFSLLTGSAHAHHSIQAIFLNPGFSDESFWRDVDQYMEAAAEQLNVKLVTFHGNRDTNRILKLGERIAQGVVPGQYVFLVNENNTGPRLFQMMEERGAYVYFILNDLDTLPPNPLVKGLDTAAASSYLGSLIPNNHWAGYQVAKEMDETVQQHFPQKKMQRWLAISGDENTPASRLREKGMKDYISEHPHIQLLQTVYGLWQEKPALEQTELLLERHKTIDAVWTANDHMAFGAMKSIEKGGLTPGKNVFIGTFNSSKAVLHALAQGKVSALGAGHFMAGGWALVLAYDHAHGKQITLDHLQQKGHFFELITPGSHDYQILEKAAWQNIPFASFSLENNKKLKDYGFRLTTP